MMNIPLRKNPCLYVLFLLLPFNATGRGTDGQHQSPPLQWLDISRSLEAERDSNLSVGG